MAWLGFLFVIVIGLILVLRGDSDTMGGLETSELMALVGGIALLAYLGLPAMRSYKGRMNQGVKDAATWAGFALLLVGLYSFRYEFAQIGQRMAGELLPPGTAITALPGRGGARSVRIRQRSDGHFVVRSRVNGTGLTMLVDTGASSVVLKNADARKIGLNISRLNYTIPVQTANGATFAAAVTLRNVTIGTITMPRVQALVSKPGALKESLLGMSFLTRLRSYEFSGEFLTLRS